MSHPNGKANGQAKQPPRSLPVVAIKVLRIEPGHTAYVRTLSTEYGGIMTHWFKGRSHFCCGANCDATMHKTKRYWKGYTPVELYSEADGLWYPWVLEITEHLELDFRGRFDRGQVWELFRYEAKTIGEPVRGVLHETVDLDKLRPAFDIVPILKTMYHWLEPMPITVKNPLPGRTIAEPTQGDAPAILTGQAPVREAEQAAADDIQGRYQENVAGAAAKKRR